MKLQKKLIHVEKEKNSIRDKLHVYEVELSNGLSLIEEIYRGRPEGFIAFPFWHTSGEYEVATGLTKDFSNYPQNSLSSLGFLACPRGCGLWGLVNRKGFLPPSSHSKLFYDESSKKSKNLKEEDEKQGIHFINYLISSNLSPKDFFNILSFPFYSIDSRANHWVDIGLSSLCYGNININSDEDFFSRDTKYFSEIQKRVLNNLKDKKEEVYDILKGIDLYVKSYRLIDAQRLFEINLGG